MPVGSGREGPEVRVFQAGGGGNLKTGLAVVTISGWTPASLEVRYGV